MRVIKGKAYLMNMGGDDMVVIAPGPKEAIDALCDYYNANAEPGECAAPIDLERMNELSVEDEVVVYAGATPK